LHRCAFPPFFSPPPLSVYSDVSKVPPIPASIGTLRCAPSWHPSASFSLAPMALAFRSSLTRPLIFRPPFFSLFSVAPICDLGRPEAGPTRLYSGVTVISQYSKVLPLCPRHSWMSLQCDVSVATRVAFFMRLSVLFIPSPFGLLGCVAIPSASGLGPFFPENNQFSTIFRVFFSSSNFL